MDTDVCPVPPRPAAHLAVRFELTRYQANVLVRLMILSARMPGGWVPDHQIGSPAALNHLRDKGRVDRRLSYGPRGARHYSWRPVRPL